MSLNNELTNLINPPRNQLKGTIGMSRTVITVANRKGFVWVRLTDNQSELIKAHNTKVSATFGMPVIVEWDGYKYEITGRDVDRYIDWQSDSPFLPAHAGQHSAMRDAEGADIVWVDSRQFLPLLVMPAGVTGSHSVSVASAPYRNSAGVWGLVGNTGTFDLPGLSSTGSNVYLMMLDDETFELYTITGSVFADDITGVAGVLAQLPPIPAFTADIPICAVKVTQDEPILWYNIYDVRQFYSNGAGGGMIFTGTYPTNLYGDVQASGTHDILATIQPNAVTNAKLADMTGPSVKGRVSGTGDPQDLGVADVAMMWVMGSASQNISSQVNGTGTHFTFTGTAYDIWVLRDGVKQPASDVTFIPLTNAFDMSYAPATGVQLEVVKLSPVVVPPTVDYIMVREEQPANTNGGTFTSGAWRTRVINTEVSDTGNHCSIASNQITLAPGTYRCYIIAPAFRVAGHKAKLYNITAGVDILIGTSAYAEVGFNYTPMNSIISGKFTLAVQSVLEIQHQCTTTFATQGFGIRSNIAGLNEIYTVAEFWKES